MNEAQANQLGMKPIEPLLREIDRAQNAGDVQRLIAKLHSLSIAAPFQLFGDSDVHDPKNVIGHVFADGLGMPDRDYYLKDEPRCGT